MRSFAGRVRFISSLFSRSLPRLVRIVEGIRTLESLPCSNDLFFSSVYAGVATVCLLTEHMTIVRQRIDVPVPRKRKGASGVHEKVSLVSHASSQIRKH